jgi:Zn-dependent peptidase ImmA (M78 family)
MNFRRGFKAEAERIALEVRRELSLTPTARLDPLLLARHLCIPVLTVRECLKVSENPASLRLLLSSESDSFSAITLFFGERRIIVHNESHAATRQANSIVHELSHCLLEHPPAPVTDRHGCRYWDATMEDEANWLSGTLLVPRAGALSFARRGDSIEAIAANYGVSVPLCRWRINQTGIPHQVRNRG